MVGSWRERMGHAGRTIRDKRLPEKQLPASTIRDAEVQRGRREAAQLPLRAVCVEHAAPGGCHDVEAAAHEGRLAELELSDA